MKDNNKIKNKDETKIAKKEEKVVTYSVSEGEKLDLLEIIENFLYLMILE
ncbi:MAG: hypothetical protein Q4A47_00295 [Erysipelotrichaceae bacterium]|nr:hypothetical protein [Erysipelotrichaceae bacterium]MDO5085824.1 hypothetical protein [Erysipelotrichaceae bacterium]